MTMVFGIIGVLMFVTIIIMLLYIRRIKLQVKHAAVILDDIADGNLDRRIVIQENQGIFELCYKINEIVMNLKREMINHRQAEKSYRRIITSLSHDIRTPLASLVGYLNAIEDGVVEKEEKDEYIKFSLEKAFDLKNYVDTLFEWLKLESGERTYHFEKYDICETTREIMIDWIPQIEQSHMEYEFDIPEEEIIINLDYNAYRRIIDNLMQNIFVHSNATKIIVRIYIKKQTVEIDLEDNGTGISEQDLPHIFNRLYKCDTARRITGNGLGLCIVNEFVKANNGEILVSSVFGKGTHFKLVFPC